MKPLVAVLGVSKKDVSLAAIWLKWVAFLCTQGGGDSRHRTLVVTMTRNLTVEEKEMLMRRAGYDPRGFSIEWVTLADENEAGYPISASHLFLRSLEHCEVRYPGSPVLWIEPDAIPLKPGWLRPIEREYLTCGKPFMGHLEPNCQPPHLAGVAVYPPNWRQLAPKLAGILCAGDIRTWGPGKGQAFDMYAGPETFPQAAQARTIQQIWKAPPFTPQNFTTIWPSTCLFHQSKDGKLINVLAHQRYPEFFNALPA